MFQDAWQWHHTLYMTGSDRSSDGQEFPAGLSMGEFERLDGNVNFPTVAGAERKRGRGSYSSGRAADRFLHHSARLDPLQLPFVTQHG